MGKVTITDYFKKITAENAGNSISETLNLNIFWGSMPPDSPRRAAFGAANLHHLIVHLEDLRLHPWARLHKTYT